MKLSALVKKEFHRFFHDPRLIITILLPGIIIYLLYSLIGSFIGGAETYQYQVYLSGQSLAVQSMQAAIEESGSKIEWLTPETPKEAVEKVKAGEASAYLVFPENFDAAVLGPSDPAHLPVVEFYYSTADDGAGEAFYAIASAVLQAYGARFTISAHNFMGEGDVGRLVMQNLLPMLVVTFIFSACMSVTLESVAGEKERGTLTTILATSVKRPYIALGKILPLSCIAALGATSSFLGVMLSLPKLMGLNLGLLLESYGFSSYLLIFLLIISLVPFIVSFISLVSTFSKSVKEASAYTSVVMIAMIVLSLVSAFVTDLGIWVAFVPILNVVSAMQQLLIGGMPVLLSLLSLGMNLIYTALLVAVVSWMLSDERIMFGK